MTETKTAGGRTLLISMLTIAFVVFVGAALTGLIYFGIRGMNRPPQKLDVPVVSRLDQVLGLERIDGVEEEGISYVETSKHWAGDPFRWTLGHAKLVVPLGEAPQGLHVRLGSPLKRTTPMRIQINGQVLFDEKVEISGDWAQLFDLTAMNLGKQATIEIISDTFIPFEINKNNTDMRTLGVCVRGISLLSGKQEYVDVLLGARPIAGVVEEGFLYQEKAGDQYCRWTTGNAKLDVPIRTKMPKSLALTLEIPNRPAFQVQVSVNGHKLFDDQLKATNNWSHHLPLDGVDLGKNARIEITSPTFVPAKLGTGNKDGRTLGVRVHKVMLISEP